MLFYKTPTSINGAFSPGRIAFQRCSFHSYEVSVQGETKSCTYFMRVNKQRDKAITQLLQVQHKGSALTARQKLLQGCQTV